MKLSNFPELAPKTHLHHIMEQGYHGLLVGRLVIFQAKWHDIVGISSPMSGERCLGFVFFNHLDLIITQEPVHKGEEHVGHDVINQSIDMWQGKIIFGLAQFKSL